ncbi:50S ribosomal protein L18 [Candidatus Daviesbacteria bacterium]|nr:50S ribosomal protein L18 [Candidatus Daviesbacteria bacterium]
MYKVSRQNRHKKIRKKIFGTKDRPRLSVFRSGQHIYAQIIDDSQGKTLVAESDLKINEGSKKVKASQVGENLAKKAVKGKIKKVVFDRGGYPYQGRLIALAEGARKGGLEF